MTTTITQSQDLMPSPVLNVRGHRKTYGGVVAPKGVDFDLMPGEIHGLCGENGAGKSTLVKILGGLAAPTEGEITVDGVPLKGGRRTDPRLISIVHQELSIIPDLSVLDNVLFGDQSICEFLFRGITAIENGTQYASVLQSPIDDGVYAAQAVADVLDGKTVEKTRFLPHEIITKDNVKDCYPANGK
ncbi:ATP-binding cassette domain-containing protein [Rhizobium leguminosarum]|uniref:ATP-binding cassette domain-containing protein n=1 Tax=Rhizobium beringeri TaxID=3019934 RepID=A0ABY1XII5_9HYPH|nr:MULTISPECIES: ATP-binding cassette domain-containing protein [Rhizobium]TBC54732.1 ATP-binding cassette domain-containing protein [Rhizobium leguminosarum]TBC86665.1 ATP-binding cassette domain-containing protein [Rhizobium leguminosarum]TBC91872.1 ATP-binding cassette domain-containing protein [Rhizobium leguminosarum]TBE58263.1 ATP-binding cassette domain-containing protein [Rhizobium beringeri]